MTIYTTVQTINSANLINQNLCEKQEVERDIFIGEDNILYQSEKSEENKK